MSIDVVLIHPEIHWNTGNAGRTCLAAGARLHLIQPLGFSLSEKKLRRAGLDYWEHVPLTVWKSWEAFEETLTELGEPFFFTTKSKRLYWDVSYGARSVLLFGRETGGIPEELLERYADQTVLFPMSSPHIRSLNLSTAVGLALYEVLRQRRESAVR